MTNALSVRILDKNGVAVPGGRFELLDDDGATCFGVVQREPTDIGPVVFGLPDGEHTVTVRASLDEWSETRTFLSTKNQFDFVIGKAMSNNSNKITPWSFGFGVFFIMILLALSTIFPNPTASQRQIWQGIQSLSLSAFASGIIGLLEIRLNFPHAGLAIQATGAIAIAIISYFFVPALA